MNYLKKAKKILDKNFFTFYKNDSILVVSEDKEALPFLHVIHDENYPYNLLLSFAVDYPIVSNCCRITLDLNLIAKVELLEEFYIAKSGNMYWGEEALKLYQWDTEVSLEQIECENELPS